MAPPSGFKSLDLANFSELCKQFETMMIASDERLDPVWDRSAAIRERRADIQAGRQSGSVFPLPEALLDQAAVRYREQVTAARAYLPLQYQETYVEPLLRNMGRVVRSADRPTHMHETAERLTGAVAQHAVRNPVRQPLRQFMAIVSNLYRSFLAPDKRLAAHVPLAAPAVAPLAVFHYNNGGPDTITAAMARLLCGAEVGVVVLPARYARHPLSWPTVAHEACGHGVLQADPNLLPDLVDGVRSLFGGGPTRPGEPPDENQALGLLWSYWIEEAAADVYGILNVGPTFALNAAAQLAAHRAVESSGPKGPAEPDLLPRVETSAGADPSQNLDTHPIDLLRVYLAIGVVESLGSLSGQYAKAYTAALEGVANLFIRNETALRKRLWPNLPARPKVVVRGKVAADRDRWVSIDREFPLGRMAEAARRVGAYIATARLGALGNHTIQDVETWDDADELTAAAISAALTGPFQVHGPDGRTRSLDELTADQLGAPPADVTAAILNDDYAALTADTRARLGLTGLTDQAARALKGDRIEALLDSPDNFPGAGELRALESGLNLDRIVSMGDDGHLLAGATLAALTDASVPSYRWINRRLAYALSLSFEGDPAVGLPRLHAMRASMPPVEEEPDPRERAGGSGPNG